MWDCARANTPCMLTLSRAILTEPPEGESGWAEGKMTSSPRIPVKNDTKPSLAVLQLPSTNSVEGFSFLLSSFFPFIVVIWSYSSSGSGSTVAGSSILRGYSPRPVPPSLLTYDRPMNYMRKSFVSFRI